MEVVKHDILTLPERGRRITDAFAFIPNRAVNLAVPKTGTAKILYMRGFRLFAMYVRTEPVHTYIAKPQNALYTQFFMTLKWCRSIWPAPHRFSQVVTVATQFWWYWTKWSCWQIAESYRQICFKFAVCWKMARKKTPGGVIPYTLSFVLSWLRSPKGGSDLSLPLIRAVTGVLNCGSISVRQKYLHTRSVSF